MSAKKQRKYKAIENAEQGITAYMFINALLDTVQDDEHPHAKVAKFVAKATLNELLYLYVEKNSETTLEDFLASLNKEAEGLNNEQQDQADNTTNA